MPKVPLGVGKSMAFISGSFQKLCYGVSLGREETLQLSLEAAFIERHEGRQGSVGFGASISRNKS